MKKQPKQKQPVSIETFYPVTDWTLSSVTAAEPSCFNGMVRIRKFRITVEEIHEPKEVLEARLLKLWRECDNYHHWSPLERAAKEIGVVLPPDERGTLRKKGGAP